MRGVIANYLVTDRLASEIKPVLSLASVLGTAILLETVEVASRLADTAEAAFAFVARLTGQKGFHYFDSSEGLPKIIDCGC